MIIKFGIAIVFTFIGLFILINYFLVRRRGIVLDATVSSYSMEEDNVHMTPIVDFTYNGEAYTVSTNMPFKKEKYPVGSAVQIYFEEKNTQYVSIKGENAQLKQGLFFLVIGVILIVLNIIKFFM